MINLVERPHMMSRWGWGYTENGTGSRAVKPLVTGHLRRVLPFRDAHQPFQNLVATRGNVREVWFYDGRIIAGICDLGGDMIPLHEWFDLGDKSEPVQIVYAETVLGKIARMAFMA